MPIPSTLQKNKFSRRLLKWYDQHGRHQLPWQSDKTLYRVWISEIMLQQTQVATVIPYYQRFMQSFPTIKALANSTQDNVLSHWAGLGYYARARNLHSAANCIVNEHAGEFPTDHKTVNSLPGIGRSTASAILALTLDQRHIILDGNVKRSLCRYEGVEGFPGQKKVENDLWERAELLTPQTRIADYTQAIMDMGALLCTRSKPNCGHCPHSKDCVAYQTNRVNTLPTPRPKKSKPHKQITMLILINQENQAVLFKRPSKGIWGGLYSFPEISSRDILDKLHNQFNCKIQKSAMIKHVFTHYSLDITPITLRCDKNEATSIIDALDNESPCGVLLDKDAQFYTALDFEHSAIGVPAPVSKILATIQSK